MKKITLWATLIILSMTGCSKTWSGMKQDTNEVMDGTRDAIHGATAPTQVPNADKSVPLQSSNVEQVKSLTPVKSTSETSTIVPMVPVI